MNIQEVLSHLEAVKKAQNGWLALCPAHEDKNPSLSISEGDGGRVVLHCFAGCETEDILNAVGLKLKDLFNDTPKTQLKHTQRPGANTNQCVKPNGCTLSDYAKAKSLPVDFLRELGVQEGRFNGIPQLIIPYHDEGGNQTAVRYRTSLNGKKKFKWRSGDKVCLYGLERLSGYEKPIIFLVEGESDCHTLWFHDIQAMGVPGANNWEEERDAPKFEKFKHIYVIIETDQQGRPDRGGEAVLKWLKNSSIKSRVYIAKLPTNDVSDLHIDNPDDFKERFKTCLKEVIPFLRYENQSLEHSEIPEKQEPTEWDRARELFPRVPFPWGILPEAIAKSLKQLARSHATSALSLPGAAMGIFASVLGPTVNISPKESWREPLIFWFGDIRPSGSGKTHVVTALKDVLNRVQILAVEDYKQRSEENRTRKKKDQRPVPRAKRYFITNLTLESLRADTTGHKGTVCVMDELSSFVSGQNQYKSKGDDREAWLTLHDGNPAYIVRAKEDFYISGARINIVGGIQPAVWQVSFGGEEGLFLTDGTIYRFLVIYENDKFYKLTAESWSKKNREAWEDPLTLAMEWSDKIITGEDWKPKNICLSEEAQDFFFDWRNSLEGFRAELPDQLKGFLPKITGYALRLTGVLYCMDCFTSGTFPGAIINLADIKNGIDAAMFYMGQAVDATQALCSNKLIIPLDITDQVKCLAETLESLKSELDSGRLAIGYIQEQFNKLANDEQKIKTPHAMGALLRKSGLTIPEGNFRANKKTGAKCLLWDKKTDSFLKQVNKVNVVNNGINHAGSGALTLKNQSQQNPQNITKNSKSVDIVDIEKSKSTPANLKASSDVDNGDIGDIVSMKNKKTELQETNFEEGFV